MLHRVALEETDVLEEHNASIIRVMVMGLLLVASSPILVTLMIEALLPFETSVLSRATRRQVPEDDILQEKLG
jgi:hypothetical protein